MKSPLPLVAALSFCALFARAADPVPVAASEADRFVDRIGVNIHLHYHDTIYGDFAKVKSALLELGVRHVRDGLVDSQWPPYYDRNRELAAAGIRCTFITGLPVERLAEVAGRVKDSLEAFEGPNEVNLNKWSVEGARNYQRQLWDSVKAGPFAATPVVALSVTDLTWAEQLGDLGAWCDFGNAHPYPGGWCPENGNAWMRADIASGLETARANCGAKPVIVTETGYNNKTSPGGHVPVSRGMAGAYLPRLFLNNHRHGIARTFWYELFNLHDKPTDEESNFGLYENDGTTPKPAGHAMRNMISLLRDPGPSFKPGRLDFALSRPEVQSVLFQKRNGEFWLTLWLPQSLWDESRPYGQKQEVRPAPVDCEIRIAGEVTSVTRHGNLDGATPEVRTIATPARFTLPVSARVQLLQITRAQPRG